MKSTLQTFEAGLNSLKDYLRCTESEARLLSLLAEKHNPELCVEAQALIPAISAAHVSRKQYVYTVAIVALYGLLERYVDSVIERHVQELAAISPTYSSMPKAIVESHVMRSMDLVKALADDKFRGGITEDQVIENLHLCLSGAHPFRVNGAAFALHRGNLTLKKIAEFLTTIGIDQHLRRVHMTAPMVEHFKKVYPDRDVLSVADLDLPALFEPINSLVERRNEVSHGVLNIEDLESLDLLKERCAFVDAYVHGLHLVFLQEIARAYSSSPKVALQLGKPIVVYDHRIVCFEIQSGEVAVGDTIIALTGDAIEPFRFGPIRRIEINHTEHRRISIDAATKIAAQVDFHARDNHKYWLVSYPNAF